MVASLWLMVLLLLLFLILLSCRFVVTGDGLVMELMEGEAVEMERPGENVEGEVALTPNLSLSPELELLPMLARETLPFLLSRLVEGVPGVAGVLPPLDGVRLGPGVPPVLDPGVPAVLDLLLGVPGVLGVLPGVPGVLVGVATGVLPVLWLDEERMLCTPFCSMSLEIQNK